jgi:hypothetical protein
MEIPGTPPSVMAAKQPVTWENTRFFAGGVGFEPTSELPR